MLRKSVGNREEALMNSLLHSTALHLLTVSGEKGLRERTFASQNGMVKGKLNILVKNGNVLWLPHFEDDFFLNVMYPEGTGGRQCILYFSLGSSSAPEL